jgi:hypothetical protein
MKKIVLVFAAFIGMSVASCGNGTQTSSCSTDTTVVDSLCVDTVSIDSVH